MQLAHRFTTKKLTVMLTLNMVPPIQSHAKMLFHFHNFSDISDRQDLKAKEKEMEHFFLARDYPQNIVSKAIDRVSRISRADALKQKEPAEEMNRVILTLTTLTVRL